MRKKSRLGASGSVVRERRIGLLCVLAAGLRIIAYCRTTPALAQERPSASKPGTASGDASAGSGNTVGEPGNSETGDDGSRSSRTGGSESFLSGIANAPGPVVVVTLVIGAMSFYLIALVVWMALNYRSSTTVP